MLSMIHREIMPHNLPCLDVARFLARVDVSDPMVRDHKVHVDSCYKADVRLCQHLHRVYCTVMLRL